MFGLAVIWIQLERMSFHVFLLSQITNCVFSFIQMSLWRVGGTARTQQALVCISTVDKVRSRSLRSY